jgi:hypothetical protein
MHRKARECRGFGKNSFPEKRTLGGEGHFSGMRYGPR